MHGLHLPSLSPATQYLALGALVLLTWLTWLGARRMRRMAPPAIWVAGLAALGCTAYSSDTSWRFAAHYLDMGSTAERVAMFAAAELALFANSLLARQNLNGPNGTPGAPGVLVWVITGVQIIPAYAESGVIGGTVRAFVGPVMAALLWHLAMGIDLRHRKPGAESNGLLAMLGREARERLLSRLGLTERDRDAAKITRDRATERAVKLAERLAAKTPEQRGRLWGQHLTRALSAAVARADVGANGEQRQKLLDQLAARRHAAGLATVELPSPWGEGLRPDPAASALATQTREQMVRASANIRSQANPRLLFADVTPVQGVDSGERSPEHPGVDEVDTAEAEEASKLSADEARSAIEDGWANGLSVRDTARLATRAPSYVHSVFVKLDEERGPRPSRGELVVVNGHGATEPGADEPSPT
ncbi:MULTISPECIES: hypothetical protein [Streptomyces]|uniref:hypothetical protein n=1 Tax=Streptomyces TaxID=1883 RepID=UPI00300DF299